jgi:hypothetical protein
MTEAEWLACTQPVPMLGFLRGKASERKLRLFACACCRLVWHLLPEPCHRLIQAVEGYADKEVRPRDLAALFDGFSPRQVAITTLPGGSQAAEAVGHLSWQWRWQPASSGDQLQLMAYYVARSAAESLAKSILWHDARRLEGYLLHDLFGPLPFRPVVFDRSWLTWHDGLLVSMARRMYDGQDFSDVPVLADALEEAGCSEPDILNHCRQPGAHVRGCWVVDHCLGLS